MVEKQRRASCYIPIIVAEQTSETLPIYDRLTLAPLGWLGTKQLGEAFIIPLSMIMCQILLDHI